MNTNIKWSQMKKNYNKPQILSVLVKQKHI